MNYLIGELLIEEVKKSGKPFRVYALERDMGECEFNQIKNGLRTASGKKLKALIDLDLLREPLTDEIKTLINDLDNELVIDIYNLIYTKLELNKRWNYIK